MVLVLFDHITHWNSIKSHSQFDIWLFQTNNPLVSQTRQILQSTYNLTRAEARKKCDWDNEVFRIASLFPFEKKKKNEQNALVYLILATAMLKVL